MHQGPVAEMEKQAQPCIQQRAKSIKTENGCGTVTRSCFKFSTHSSSLREKSRALCCFVAALAPSPLLMTSPGLSTASLNFRSGETNPIQSDQNKLTGH